MKILDLDKNFTWKENLDFLVQHSNPLKQEFPVFFGNCFHSFILKKEFLKWKKICFV